MSRTANLRRQHDDAVAIVGEFNALLAGRPGIETRDGAFQATLLLAKLTGLLRIHFAQEDRQLYPSLMASGGRAAMIARRFVDEMGDLGPTYGAFAQRWESAARILSDPRGFRRESKAVFTALADRITRENEQLYPIADAQMDADAPLRAA
ncbi:hemerythrin domain-containing protein [Sphingomonas montanisoli]|uniref:Hemerythrin domain-containing protein n=1 Tax=Sphingomonas montanisoli TaxID=2606412 RepID=A0A5D9C3E1_9SPHN|nr:hemerythrin domain-containing protein [Sphingomonas montanisoli]TZG26189.1 hemerythrin domain-containing protein [Sphingomonas montanisoli]